MATPEVAGEGRGVGSWMERVVTAEPWSVFERPLLVLDPRAAARDWIAGEDAVLEGRRSFAFFDGQRWAFGPVSSEEEAAWRELETRLARSSG